MKRNTVNNKVAFKLPYINNMYEPSEPPKTSSKAKAFLSQRFPQLRSRYLKWHYVSLVNKFIKDFMKDPQPFLAVEIETVNRCNFACEFCPVNRTIDPRPFKLMEESLFKKIIDELGAMNWSNYITLYSNNEPFMDKRIVEFIQYARAKVPKAYIHLTTNGSLLTVEKLKEILPFISLIVVDNYNDDFILTPENQKLYDYCVDHQVDKNKIVFSMRKEHEVLTSRGGQAPNKGKVKTIKSKCYLPFRQLVIRPDGKVSLCNNDVYGKYTLGDVNHQSLMEIWHSSQSNEIRSEMHKSGRKNLELCKNCDTKLTGEPWTPIIDENDS